MEKATRKYLAEVARELGQGVFHGYVDGMESNIAPIVAHFPKWNIVDADGLWCAAFVLHCCLEAGFEIPYSPDECVTCSLAGCGGWEEFAMGDGRIEYHPRGDGFVPGAGDIVIYDRVFENKEHDHIGIVLEIREGLLIAAEGNAGNGNVSSIMERKLDGHIRAFIRIPDGYKY